MPEDRVYALIPIKRQNEQFVNENDREEQILDVKVKYNKIPIRDVKAGEVSSNISKGEPILIT